MKPTPIFSALALAGALSVSSCTIVDTHTTSDPSGVHMHGLVDGFATLGMAESRGLFRLGVLDGPNSGSIASVNLSNLLALDVGLLGAAITIGPIHLGLGTLFYSPDPPPFPSDDDAPKDKPSDAEEAPGVTN